VNLFGCLPYSARACYRASKDIVRSQPALKRLLKQISPVAGHAASEPGVDEVLLRGSLGEHFRSMFRNLSFVDLTPGLFSHVDEQYLQGQLKSFQRGERLDDFRLISKIASLEHWARQLTHSAASQSPGM
jgi:hypothetical protein